MFYINSSPILKLSSVLANFGSLNIGTLGKLSIGAATATEKLSIIATNVSQKLSCTTGDAALYLFSGTLGRSSWVCNSTGQVYFKASQNTTGQSIKFQASSLVTNLTMNADGSSSFGTNSVSITNLTVSGVFSCPTIYTKTEVDARIATTGNLKLYDHNYGSFTSGVISHPYGLQFAITSNTPPTIGSVLMSIDTTTGVAVNTSLDVLGNLSVGGVFDCPTIYTKTECDRKFTTLSVKYC